MSKEARDPQNLALLQVPPDFDPANTEHLMRLIHSMNDRLSRLNQRLRSLESNLQIEYPATP